MKQKYNKNTQQNCEMLSPPRSDKYKQFTVLQEQNIKIGNNKYLMRNLSNGAVELVRYDYETNMWSVLCFSDVNNATQKQAV